MSDYKFTAYIKKYFPDYLGNLLDKQTLFNKLFNKIKAGGWNLDDIQFGHSGDYDTLDFYLTKEGSLTLSVIILIIIGVIGFCYCFGKVFNLATAKVEYETTAKVSDMADSIQNNPDLTTEQKATLKEALYNNFGTSTITEEMSLTEKIIVYGAIGLGAVFLIMSFLGEEKPAGAVAPAGITVIK